MVTGRECFLLQAGKEYWEITEGESIEYRLLQQKPNNLADYYGRLGDSWSGEGVRYQAHKLRNRVLNFTDPTQGLKLGDAIFLNDGREILLDMGGYVYLIDLAIKRLGPVLPGGNFIALAPPFSTAVNF